MENRIADLIALIKTGDYDKENTHAIYDDLLEDFIKEGHSKKELPIIAELIALEKDFWYA